VADRKIVALVPMRHHSQRVPGKNYRELGGKPLFHHILDSLNACPEVDQIVVDTDSDVILSDLERSYPDVVRIERPERLREDSIPMNEILMYDTSQVPADLYLQTHSTNPFLRPVTISQSIKDFLAGSPPYDSLFSVTRLQTRLWDENTIPINHDPDVLLQTQDLPPVFEENSCIYLFTRENLVRRGNRIGEHPMMFETPVEEALDIDEESDFIFAEALIKTLGKR
jgi:CMP-N-acetylneuraminic acid synthetase